MPTPSTHFPVICSECRDSYESPTLIQPLVILTLLALCDFVLIDTWLLEAVDVCVDDRLSRTEAGS